MTEEEYKILRVGDYINDHQTGKGVITKLEGDCITAEYPANSGIKSGFGLYKNWGERILVIRDGKILYTTPPSIDQEQHNQE